MNETTQAHVIVTPGAGHLPAGVLRLLDGWLPGRRWYPVPGEGVRNVPWLTVTFPHAPEVVVPLLRLEGPGLPGGDESLVVQVPLVLTPTAEPPEDTPGLVGTVRMASGIVEVSDGGAHPACWLAYLRAAAGDVSEDALDGARALGGEQSNTSVVVPALGSGAMLKILRTVALGPHPDVTIPEALTRAGWDGVPRFVGAVDLPAPSGGPAPAGSLLAHLGVVSQLVADARDGFELACDHARRDEDFGERAAELGAVVAQLHAVLRGALPAGQVLEPAGFVGVLRRRAAEAFADVRELAPYRAGATALFDEVRERLAAAEGGVSLQAIHGDLHLGQALYGRDGWKVLDFEGEPQRPVAERTAPDLPLRDVAGMLRSFDYAAAVGGATDPRWTERAQLSFLEGYREAQEKAGAEERGTRPGGAPASDTSGLDLATTDALLRALVLDKALYEVVYETRHRPGWTRIPLAAVARVLNQ